MDERPIREEVRDRLGHIENQVGILTERNDRQHSDVAGKLDRVTDTLHGIDTKLLVHLAAPSHAGTVIELARLDRRMDVLEPTVEQQSRFWAAFRWTVGVLFALLLVVLGAVIQNSGWHPFVWSGS